MPSLGTDRTGGQGRYSWRLWAVAFAVIAVSAHLRWTLADLADWGIDEAANLWLASAVLSGHRVALGLISSHGVPNMAGAPLLAAPLAWLPRLLDISRALSVVHLGALCILGLALWRRGAALVATTVTLACFPGLLLASSSVWNQYLTIPLTAFATSLLLVLTVARGGALVQAGTLTLYAFVAVLLPAVHLIGFADAAVYVLLGTLILTERPRPVDRTVLACGLLLVGAFAVRLYTPWLYWLAHLVGPARLALGATLAAAGAIGTIRVLRRRASLLLGRAAAWPRSTSLVFAALCLCLCASAILPFIGAQVGRRMLFLWRPAGYALLAAQVGIVWAFLPGVLRLRADCRTRPGARALLATHFEDPACAAVLLLHAVLLSAARLVMAPTLLLPGGRSDLLLAIVPALLAPVLLLRLPDRVASGHPTLGEPATVSARLGVSVVCAIGAAYWLAASGLVGIPQKRYPLFVPPSEMTAVVEWIAAQHREQGGGGSIDVGYDLDKGIEWIPTRGCGPDTPWYTIGRQYDWILRRAHGLANVREGTCDRRGGSVWQVGYRGVPAAGGLTVVRAFEHLEIRARDAPSR